MSTQTDKLATSEVAWAPFVQTEVLGDDRLRISMHRWAPPKASSPFHELESMGAMSQGHHHAHGFRTSFVMALSLYRELGKALEIMRPGCTDETAAT
jgi:hypothetical protein